MIRSNKLKRIVVLILSVCVLLSFSACGGTDSTTESDSTTSLLTTEEIQATTVSTAETEESTTATSAVQDESTTTVTTANTTSAVTEADAKTNKVTTQKTKAAKTKKVTTKKAAATKKKTADKTTAKKASQSTKVLVAYFSCTGTTKTVAERLADGTNAELYRIVPKKAYTNADLNYNNDDSRSTKEMNDPNSRPAISGSVKNMGQYDIVFIGYPIWWGEAPRIVSTFMESYDFSGKTVIPFCTSGGSGLGSSGRNLEKLTSGADFLQGRGFGSGASKSTIVSWVNGLDLDITAE